MIIAQSPCFCSPCQFPFASFPFPFTYLETLLGMIGSRPPWPRVTRKLTSPFLNPFPFPPHSKFPASLLRFPQHSTLIRTTTRSRLPESGTQMVPWYRLCQPWVQDSCQLYSSSPFFLRTQLSKALGSSEYVAQRASLRKVNMSSSRNDTKNPIHWRAWPMVRVTWVTSAV